MELMIVDLDGTLFDTKEINFRAYKEVLESYGYSIEYTYFCKFCNGKHYTEFLPHIATNDKKILIDIHEKKKQAYSKYLEYGRVNRALVDLIKNRGSWKAVLVTTASRQNTYDILNHFELVGIFDAIITQEDITRPKPNPEGFFRAMEKYNITPEKCLIFEDSEVGIEAAEQTGGTVFVVKGYN